MASWKRRLEESKPSEVDVWAKRVAQLEAQLADSDVAAEMFGLYREAVARRVASDTP